MLKIKSPKLTRSDLTLDDYMTIIGRAWSKGDKIGPRLIYTDHGFGHCSVKFDDSYIDDYVLQKSKRIAREQLLNQMMGAINRLRFWR